MSYQSTIVVPAIGEQQPTFAIGAANAENGGGTTTGDNGAQLLRPNQVIRSVGSTSHDDMIVPPARLRLTSYQLVGHAIGNWLMNGIFVLLLYAKVCSTGRKKCSIS